MNNLSILLTGKVFGCCLNNLDYYSGLAPIYYCGADAQLIKKYIRQTKKNINITYIAHEQPAKLTSTSIQTMQILSGLSHINSVSNGTSFILKLRADESYNNLKYIFDNHKGHITHDNITMDSYPISDHILYGTLNSMLSLFINVFKSLYNEGFAYEGAPENYYFTKAIEVFQTEPSFIFNTIDIRMLTPYIFKLGDNLFNNIEDLYRVNKEKN